MRPLELLGQRGGRNFGGSRGRRLICLRQHQYSDEHRSDKNIIRPVFCFFRADYAVHVLPSPVYASVPTLVIRFDLGIPHPLGAFVRQQANPDFFGLASPAFLLLYQRSIEVPAHAHRPRRGRETPGGIRHERKTEPRRCRDGEEAL